MKASDLIVISHEDFEKLKSNNKELNVFGKELEDIIKDCWEYAIDECKTNALVDAHGTVDILVGDSNLTGYLEYDIGGFIFDSSVPKDFNYHNLPKNNFTSLLNYYLSSFSNNISSHTRIKETRTEFLIEDSGNETKKIFKILANNKTIYQTIVKTQKNHRIGTTESEIWNTNIDEEWLIRNLFSLKTLEWLVKLIVDYDKEHPEDKIIIYE